MILLAAAGLRLWGIGWGLPNTARYYPYHPDESVLLAAIARLAPFRGDFLPTFYNYPSLYLVLCRVAVDFAAGYHLVRIQPQLNGTMATWVGDFARILLIGRLVAVGLAVGTVGLVYAATRRLYGRRPAWLAAFFLAAAPLHVLHAHYMAVDIPATFFVALCLYACARAMPRAGEDTRFRISPWLGIGAAAGLAAGTKYTAGAVLFAGLAPLTAATAPWCGFRWRPFQPGRWEWARFARWCAGIALMGLASGVVFLATTPGVLLETPQFLHDFLYELLEHSRRGHGEVFRALPPAGLYHLEVSLPLALGWPLFLPSIAGLLLAAWRRRPADWLLLLAVVPYYLLMARSELRFIRYMAPLLPPLVILAARFVAWCGAQVRRHAGPRPARAAVLVLGGAALAAALASSIAHDQVMAGEDPRDRAARWLLQTTPPGATIALATNPWFYTPPIDPSAGCITVAAPFGGPPIWDRNVNARGERPLAPVDFGGLRLLATQGWPDNRPDLKGTLPVDALERWRPDRVVISDYEYADPLRIGRRNRKYARANSTLQLLDAMRSSYVLEREFRVRPRLLGLEWFSRSTPPHDWAYFMPTIQVYRHAR